VAWRADEAGDGWPQSPSPSRSSTRSRLLGTHALAAAATYAALLWLPAVAVVATQLWRDAACLAIDLHARGVTPAQRLACARAETLAVAARWGAGAAFLAFAAVAARARGAARALHRLPGGPAADCALWLCCAPLALAQEARTAAAGRCQGGAWGGEEGGGEADLEAPPD